MYILILGGIAIIFMYYAVLNEGPHGTFGVILNLLVYMAFIETLLIFIHHLWKHVLRHYKFFIAVETWIETKRKECGIYKKKHKTHVPLEDVSVYENYLH